MAKFQFAQETGKPMVRDVRPMEISSKGQSATIMPGWYRQDSRESVTQPTI